MEILHWNQLDTASRKAALSRPAQDSHDTVAASVSEILQRVKNEGDKALREFAAKFDHCTDESLQLTEQEIAQACERLAKEQPLLKQAIDQAYTNISTFHAAQAHQKVSCETMPGVFCQTATHPLDSVGLYVPGGSAPLVSTALMLGVPAQIANCREVVLTSPHPVSDAIVYAASKCKISKIFKLGGAHAIAAMAYGTESVPKVCKIFGPGNQYVTCAKSMVANDIDGAAIDMPAGPSEVLVIADKRANPDFVAADLLSQAEHGPDSQAILVSDSLELVEKTQKSLEQQLAQLSRSEIAAKSLAKSRMIVCKDKQECVEISNEYAPEHLIVQILDPESILGSLRNAGSIFVGDLSCESMGDYASGTNHTLPTYGYAKTYSALGLDDFVRRYTISYATQTGIQNLGPIVRTLADAEGLDAHRRAIEVRLNYLTQKNADQ